MANSRTDINAQLNSLNNIAAGHATTVLNSVSDKSKDLKVGVESLSDDLGAIYDPQAVQDGIKTISKKVEGTVNGASLTEIKDGVPGLSIPNDLTTKKLTINGEEKTIAGHLSGLLGTVEPTKKLNFEALGGESLNAINEAISTGIAKVRGVTNSIINAIRESNDSAGNVLDDLTSDINFGGLNDLITSSGNVTRGITVGDIKSAATSDIPLDKVTKDIGNAVSGLVNTVLDVEITTGGGSVQDIAENLSRTTTNQINDLTSKFKFSNSAISDFIKSAEQSEASKGLTVKEILLNDTEISTEMQEVIKSTNDSPSTRAMSDAVAGKARARGIPESEVKTILDRITKIEVVINNVDTTLSGTIPKTNADYFLREKKLTNLVNKFEYVDSIEELSGEFRTLSRSVTECIIHASDTFTNQNIGSNEIDAVHKEDGYDGIQFHYVIRRDGRIQRGKPVNDKSLASNINGHENYTIDICLIGGINAPSGTENAGDLLSDKSYTIKQWQSLKLFLWAFYTRFPGGIVMGYGDIDASSNEPYFDVIEYVREGFGKVNPYDNTYSDTPLDGSNLIKKRVEIF